MMNHTRIEWCDMTWNPVTGCTRGCSYCYARRMAQRLRGRFGYPADDPFRPTFHPERLDQPLWRQKPSRIFVCSMGDLFDPTVPDEWRDRVFAVMALADWGVMDLGEWHSFILLTKQAERMAAYLNGERREEAILLAMRGLGWFSREELANIAPAGAVLPSDPAWPLPNVRLGVSVSDQRSADERIPHLLQTPAAARFVSAEPLLGAVDLEPYLRGRRMAICDNCWQFEGDEYSQHNGTCGRDDTRVYYDSTCEEFEDRRALDFESARNWLGRLDWLIIGAQTGPGAVKPDPEWVQRLIEQGREAGVPLFVKDNVQWPAAIQEVPLCG